MTTFVKGDKIVTVSGRTGFVSDTSLSGRECKVSLNRTTFEPFWTGWLPTEILSYDERNTA